LFLTLPIGETTPLHSRRLLNGEDLFAVRRCSIKRLATSF